MSEKRYDVSTFQGLILALQDYWARQGCVILQPLDLEVGAGTFHPATFLRAIGPETWNTAYVQPCRRPKTNRAARPQGDSAALRRGPMAVDRPKVKLRAALLTGIMIPGQARWWCGR